METAEENQPLVEPPTERLWTRKNAFLLLSMAYANFTLGTCFSLPAPFFPKEAEKKGVSPSVYGLVFGVFQLVNLVMSPTWGKLMPHLVPRFVLVAGIIVAGSCSVLFGILEYCPPRLPYIALCFFVRIVESIGVTAYITTCYGLLPVLFPNHVATLLSTMETLFGFGMIAGPTVGGALYQLGGFKLPFIVMGGCLILGAVFTSVTLAGKDDPPNEKTGSIFSMMASGAFVMDLVIFSVGFICIGFNDSTLEPHLRQFSLSPTALGGVFIIVGGIYAFSSPVYGFLIDKGLNPLVLCLFGCTLCLVAFLLIGPVPFLPIKTSMPLVIVSLVLQGFGIGAKAFSAFMHGMKDVLARGFPDNVSTYALFTGLMSAMSAAGAFAGPSLGGFLLDHGGYENGTLYIVGIETFLMVIVVVFMISQYMSKPKILVTIQSPEDPEINSIVDEKTPLLVNDQVQNNGAC